VGAAAARDGIRDPGPGCRSGPATLELGEEPPAVVDLLTNDWRVTADAIPATLLDLAARDYLDLEQYGPGRTVCRVRRTSGEGLEAYERMVLDHVAGLAVDGVVPAEALTTGPQDQSSRWWRAFQRGVVRDARERGLARDRWSGSAKAFLRAAALVPAGLGVLYANAAGGLDFGTIGAGLVIWVVLTSAIKLFGDQRNTPAGAEAAARWLGVRDYLGDNEVFPTLPPVSVAIWDRYLGYGAALGVATAVHALPMGAEDDHRAWSAFGGRWRVVKVRYPRLGFAWGRKPPLAFLVGLVQAVAGYVGLRLMLGLRGWTDGYAEADQAARWVRTASTLLAVAALLVAGWGVWTMLRAMLDLVSRRGSRGRSCAGGPTAGGTTSSPASLLSTPGARTRSRPGWSRRACMAVSGRAGWSGRPSGRGWATFSGSSSSARAAPLRRPGSRRRPGRRPGRKGTGRGRMGTRWPPGPTGMGSRRRARGWLGPLGSWAIRGRNRPGW
jgi:hypothetical protein